MITIRRMMQADVDRAAEIEKDNFSMPWTKKDFQETLQLSYAFYYIAEEEGKIIGICGLRNIAGEGEVTNVAVDRSFRRRGVAKLLLAEVLREGKKQGIEAFTLEVRAGNEAAIRLYETFGFQKDGFRKNFYENPTEDALIMWKR
ncbi:ribosomal protein S18-alanine N-acetyltransferase [Kineothrix sp. MB12-C1]|uniref:ribosomal protein S18-alanine N-acetyltransferase n=1 Tax=Kineothrix sp. MB12-C1 TaxID=3070215 RepID=UPI0027D2A192|nr:ribosomal protein S18-alanine N-acetyltransferase [Kineothrix sp. MB12-C1]WMC93701.1 ribosomal protein S18-alanine N-acetyltransferase [Kineothrix sp. MB12-C1]